MDNPEKLTTFGTQDEDQQNKKRFDLLPSHLYKMFKRCLPLCFFYTSFQITHVGKMALFHLLTLS